MLKVFVDSGSSIKPHEKEKYNVEIIPLKILLGDKEYFDGVDLTNEIFYDFLINQNEFPKTSLPSLDEVENQINECIKDGHEVIIVTISSEISGTFNAMRLLFEDNPKVRVIDSRLAVGGIRIIVEEINRNKDLSLDEIVNKVNLLIPRIKIAAIPETLEYLYKGGRLSKKDYLLGSLLHIKPIIGFEDGKVKMLAKTIGIKKGIKYLYDSITDGACDLSYPIVPSMTYSRKHLDTLLSMLSEEYLNVMTDIDDLDHAIAAHWGPNAFGLIYVTK